MQPGGPSSRVGKTLRKKAKKGANKNSDDAKDNEASKDKDKKDNEQCKLMTPESFTFSHPSSHGFCGCGVSMDYTVSFIPGVLIGQSVFLNSQQ